MFNQATLIGYLGRNPDIKVREGSEDAFAVVSLATSEKWKDDKGERREATEWHRLVFFRKSLVDWVREHLKKGTLILVQGRIHTRKWEDESGNEGYSTEIIVNDFPRVVKWGDDKGAEPETGNNGQPPQ